MYHPPSSALVVQHSTTSGVYMLARGLRTGEPGGRFPQIRMSTDWVPQGSTSAERWEDFTAKWFIRLNPGDPLHVLLDWGTYTWDSVDAYGNPFSITFHLPAVAIDIESWTPADWNADGFVNGVDFDMFIDAFEQGDADWNDDGYVNGVDFDMFTQAWEAGA